MKLEQKEYQKRLYNQVDEDLEKEEVETAQLDYSGQITGSEAALELPPAWEPEPSSWTVGYEPVGATSIGVEQERRTHSRRRGLRAGQPPTVHRQGNRLSRLSDLIEHMKGKPGVEFAEMTTVARAFRGSS
jgi:hypothetical protein